VKPIKNKFGNRIKISYISLFLEHYEGKRQEARGKRQEARGREKGFLPYFLIIPFILHVLLIKYKSLIQTTQINFVFSLLIKSICYKIQSIYLLNYQTQTFTTKSQKLLISHEFT
jgi:hypothetical protein